jgi:DNA-binding NarL/FixJ family response regulator
MNPHDRSGAPIGADDGAQGDPAGPPRRQRVLVVEDQALIALALAADLTAMYCDVVGRAATGATAVELARRYQPDIVVMDVALVGGMDGIEAAALIKAESAPRIIFVTAHADGPDRPRLEALKPAAILGKPYHPSELNLAVNLSSRQRVRRAANLAAAAGD